MHQAGEGEWDYIIVGAGSAGCVLAERLSADPSVRVLLLEEGTGGDTWLTRLPKGFAKLLADAKRASYHPVTFDRGVANAPPEVWARGKLLGGSSAVNGMVWMRGQPEDYESFAAAGLPEWGWDALRPCFRALEDNALGPDDERGTGGPIRITTTRPSTRTGEAVLAAGRKAGLATIELNRANQEGLGYLQVNIDDKGRRASAARTLLRRARRRNNLTIRSGIRIDRVIFSDKRAIGVEGRAGKRPVRFLTGGEVVLSAGALITPAILQRSGIGPAPLLDRLKIPLVRDARMVGKNLREHFLMQLQFRLRSGRDSDNGRLSGPGLALSVLRYALTGAGALSTGPYHIGGFAKTLAGANRPDAQIMFMPTSMDYTGKGVLEREPGMALFAYQCRPESKGRLEITSADPDAPALIEPNYLAEAGDRVAAVAMVRYVRSLAHQSPLAERMIGETDRTVWAQTDEEILDCVRRYGQAGYHACSTCAMGADETAVVDSHLRVRGVRNLRIMDLSVFPDMVSGNTNAPVMAMAWRAAQLFLADRVARLD